jgi:CPA2 family monovalent cation:H+ antiporter-2
MHEFDLILTLTCGLTAALVLGYITHRLSLSPIVGYLLAGIVVGPATPGFVANKHLADQMAEIGVILLMFGVGLHFDLKDLLSVRRVAVPGALGQSLVATLLGSLVGWSFGWSWSAGLVFGISISVASTVVMLRVLADNNDLHTATGRIAVGWLVVEDLFAVLALVLLPVVLPDQAAGVGYVAVALMWSLVKIALLIAFVFYVGGQVIPWFLALTARSRSRELFTLAVLVVALGIAAGATRLFGVSPALGAFLAGMVVGQSEFSSRAASEALPMRDAFAVLFFVSVGMLFDPAALIQSPQLIVATLAIIMLGNSLAALAIVALLRYPLRVALSLAIAVGQVGEFSFMLASQARSMSILPEAAESAIVAAALISISLNPALYRVVDFLERRVKRSPRLSAWLARPKKAFATPELHADGTAQDQAVVVGYGPVGRTLVRMLQENDIEPTVIELNLDTVQRLREDGIRAVYGDCTHSETLAAAGAERAVAFVLTSVGMEGSEEAIRLAREINPRVRVLARAGYLRELPALRKAGADVVFSGEGEVALTMTEFLLRQLGASEEQIDRQRARIRDELFGSTLAVELLMPAPSPKNQPHSDAPRQTADAPQKSSQPSQVTL